MDTVKTSVVAWGWGKEGMNRWSTEDWKGSDNTLHNAIMMIICHYTFVFSL